MVELTKPQERLLRTLGRAAYGVELGGSWVGTGRALVTRGLAPGGRSFVSITDAGRDALAELQQPETTSGGER
jgi:hypothetical protein